MIKSWLKCGGFHDVHGCIFLFYLDLLGIFNHGLWIDGDFDILYHLFLLCQRGSIHQHISIR